MKELQQYIKQYFDISFSAELEKMNNLFEKRELKKGMDFLKVLS